ncbi:carboxypeptidase S [Mycena latifolia]|nr:carboxypeptidase S [Mycena latifolia]
MLPLSDRKPSFSSESPSKKAPSFPAVVVWGGLLAAAIFLSLHVPRSRHFPAPSVEPATTCPQVDVLIPERNAGVWAAARDHTATPAFKTRAIDWLAGAVRIPTESYDDMQPVGIDPRWDIFDTFHAYLAQAFPLVHASLKLQKINTYALLYEWTGSDNSLKPVLLAGHQDVVPVNPSTVESWDYPPYSGYFNGTRIWGRGSLDDKNGLIGILAAVESLLEHGFAPTRTFILAFGFDEEISGLQGAAELAKVLLSTYGQDSFAFIVDEGAGLIGMFGIVGAFPGVAEKGYMDVVVEVTSPGGHSSQPPDHTSIGMLAAMLVQYEDHPYKLQLSRESTPYHTFQCLGQYGTAMSPEAKRIIADSVHSDEALAALETILSRDKLYRSQIGTTQAIDVIHGGVKANALPEQASALVNHRILAESSIAEVRAHDTALLRPLAEHFNLTYTAFGDAMSDPGAPASGTLTLTDTGYALEPAPVTPTTGSAPYDLLSGSIIATYSTRHSGNGDNNTVVVVPFTMLGNTDTRYYWGLSPHIFRYGHGNSAGRGIEDAQKGMHTVNESIDADDFVETIRFFVTLMLNADESSVV